MDLDEMETQTSFVYTVKQPALLNTLALPPNMCPEYFETIAKFLRVSETQHRPSKTYLEEKQKDVSISMRCILIDWLNEVTEEFNLKVETLCLAVNYADRYLSKVSVQRNRLQLVGVASLLIASKFEEIVPPSVDDFVYITDNTYTRNEVIKMELSILNELKYDLSAVTTRDFVGIYLKLAQANNLVCMLVDYLIELTLQDYAFLRWSPSKIAASAVVLALLTANLQCWTDVLAQYTLYQPAELNECLKEMVHSWKAAPHSNLQAVREKYSHSRYLRVSTLKPPAEAPAF